jgi:cellulose synthase/poly-beta-1,6-N-acetylglucosamine synthase-like glycosyltransferase
LKSLFWGSLGALGWTHLGYPVAAAVLARLRSKEVRRRDVTPSVTLVVAAHDEEAVIERWLEIMLALDYPDDRLEIVVASDGSRDGTDELVRAAAARDSRVSLLRCAREGKVAALNAAVATSSAELVAFSDANTLWAPSALACLVRNFADPQVGYVCGRLELEPAQGTNREGLYWRYELWLRKQESALGSITGGNGGIYAVRRRDYISDRFGHDLGLPHRMVARGLRAVYDPAALAFERPSRDLEDEYRRKARMLPWDWQHLFEGRMFSGVGLLYSFELVSHRVLRYCSGLLHVTLLVSCLALSARSGLYRWALASHLAVLGLAAAGRRRAPVPGADLAYYYVLVTSATVVGLGRYLRGVPSVWEHAPGSR